MDEISLRDLRIDAVIGILPHERLAPQPLRVEVRLSLDLTAAARTGDLGHSVDYARLAREVRQVLVEGRCRLLETAGLALCQLCLERQVVQIAAVTITKPLALGPDQGRPSVTIRRSRTDQVAPSPQPTTVTIFATDELIVARASLTSVAPGTDLLVRCLAP